MKSQIGYLSTSIENSLFNSRTYKIVMLLLILLGIYISWILINEVKRDVIFSIINYFLEGSTIILFLLLYRKKENKFSSFVYRQIYFYIPAFLLYSTIICSFEVFLNLFIAFSLLFFGFVTRKKQLYIIYSLIITVLFGIFLYYDTTIAGYIKKVVFIRLLAFNILSLLVISYKMSFLKKLIFYENIFSNVFNDFSEGILLVECKNYKIVLSNDTTYKLSIFNDNEILGKELCEVIDNSYLKENISSIFNQNQWEKDLQIEDDSNKWIKLSIYNIDGNKTYKVCKIENISSKKLAESVYEKIHNTDESYINNVLIINTDFIIEYANTQYIYLSGFEKEEIIGTTLNEQMLKPVIGYSNFYDSLRNGLVWEGEFERNKKNGDVVYEKTIATPYGDKSGVISHYVLNFEDITINKKVEQALKYSEQFNSGLTKAIPDLIFVFDEFANIVDLVDNNENILNINTTNFKGKNVSEVFDIDFKKKTLAKIAAIKTYNEVEIYEYEVNNHISGKIYFEARMIGMNKKHFLTAIRNITDEKFKENQLRQAQQRYYTLFSKANDAILIIEDYKFVEFNDRALDIFYCESEYLYNVNPADLSPKYQENGQLSTDLATEYINKALKGQSQIFTWLHTKKGGDVFIAQISLNSFFEGNKGYVQVIIRDITAQQTQQKELERVSRVLQESERRLSTLMNNLPGMAYRCKNDRDWTMEFVNWGSYEISGYTPDELINNNKISYNDLIFEDDRQYVWDEVKKSTDQKQPFKLNYRIVTKKNQIKWVWEQGEAILDYDDNIIAIEGFITDITKEKEFEIDLIESQQKYYKLFNEAFDSIMIMQNSIFIDCNEKALEMFECRKYDIIGADISKIIPENQSNTKHSYTELKNIIDETLEGRPQFAQFEFLKMTGDNFFVEISISCFELENNTYLQFIIRDITDRINAEKKVALSEKNNRNLIESSPMGIMITNLKKVFFVNNSAVNILGFENEEQLKKFNLTKLVSKESGRSILEYLKKHSEVTEENEFMDVVIKQPFDDSDIEAKAVLFEYNGKKAYQIVLRDVSIQKRLLQEKLRSQMIEEHNQKLLKEVTERISAEEKLTHSLEEKDLLLKEVHHRVKNNMQIISSILNLQAGYIQDKVTKSMFQESQDRIKSMALIHENLYRNKDLSLINFKDYVVSLVNNLYRSYEIDNNIIKLNLDIDEIFFNLDIAIPCGLIINEILSNALKYAFIGFNEGFVSVKLSSSFDEFTLIVGDNGIGINKKIDLNNAESLGLQLITTLVDQIDGTLELENNTGTKYIIKFKK